VLLFCARVRTEVDDIDSFPLLGRADGFQPVLDVQRQVGGEGGEQELFVRADQAIDQVPGAMHGQYRLAGARAAEDAARAIEVARGQTKSLMSNSRSSRRRTTYHRLLLDD